MAAIIAQGRPGATSGTCPVRLAFLRRTPGGTLSVPQHARTDQGHQDLDAACPRGLRPFHGAPVLRVGRGFFHSGSRGSISFGGAADAPPVPCKGWGGLIQAWGRGAWGGSGEWAGQGGGLVTGSAGAGLGRAGRWASKAVGQGMGRRGQTPNPDTESRKKSRSAVRFPF